MSGSNPQPASSRWTLAEEITAVLCRQWPAEIHAIGVHGSLAHDDQSDSHDIDLVVVTYRPGAGPLPTIRRVEGIIIDLDVICVEEYLGYARSLSTSWPLVADQYLTTKPLYDPAGWHPRLRDAHLARLAETGGGEFAALARDAWCHAEATYAEAMRLAQWHDTGGALLTLGAARLATAVVEGLLTRTYFRDSADAVRRTGLGDLDVTEVGRRLHAQAHDLAERGRPVDATVGELLRTS